MLKSGAITKPACTYEELHFRDFLVDFFHELDDEVDKLMLQHLFRVEVRDQERDIVPLDRCQHTHLVTEIAMSIL
jgi:hypothetical protein